MRILIIIAILLSSCTSIQYEPRYIDTSSLIYKTNELGQIQSHRGMYIIKENKIYQTDSVGNIQYHKGSLKRAK